MGGLELQLLQRHLLTKIVFELNVFWKNMQYIAIHSDEAPLIQFRSVFLLGDGETHMEHQ